MSGGRCRVGLAIGLAAAALCAFAPAAARETEPPAAAVPGPAVACGPGTVRAARLEGCGTARCRARGFEAGVLELADLVPGRPIDPAAVEAAVQRLRRLGFFREVSIACGPAGDGLEAVVRVVPATRIRRIRVEGNDHFYASSIVDRITTQAGDAFEPGTQAATETSDRIRDTVRRMYQDEGYAGTRVDVEAVAAAPAEVDLVLKVREGERLRVETIAVALAPAREAPARSPQAAPYREQCPAPRARDLRSWSGLSVGQPYTERTLPEGVRRLTRALRAIGFAGVKVLASYDPPTRRVRFEATYQSCWLVRFFARDAAAPGRSGYVPLADADLVEAMPFGDSGVFDATEAEIGREEVRQFFENRGHLFADVVLDYRTRDSGDQTVQRRSWAPHVAGILSYLVTRNGRVEIRGIRFKGNRSVPDDDLKAAMSTRAYDFFGDPGAVLPDQVFYDLEKIVRLYRQRGFPTIRFAGGREGTARVRETVREGRDLVYTYVSGDRAFRVRRPPLTEGVYLEIGLEEGPRSVVGTVAIRGATALSNAAVAEQMGLAQGGPFCGADVQEGAARLVRHLSNDGYLGATVNVVCEGHDPDVPRQDCRLDEVTSRRVDLDVEVIDGRRTKVGPVFVEGNRRTVDSVLLRDFPAPGEPYDVGKVAEAIRRLKDLGIFNSVQLTTVGADEKPPRERLGVVINTREARARFIDLAGGFETLDRSMSFPGYLTSPITTAIGLEDRSTHAFGRTLGLQIPDVLVTAELRYTDQNFLGRAKRLYLPFKYGLSATAWDRYAAFTPTFLDPRFFVRGLTFRFTPFAIYDRATTRLDVIQFGAEFALSKELAPRLFASFSYEVAGVKSRDTDVTSVYSPFRLENKVVPTLTWDRVDNAINPTKGGVVQASLSYINALTRGTTPANFLKWEVTGKLYVSARRIVTLALMARYGASMSFGGSVRLPQEERFTLGGNRGVRGFSNDAIAQYRSDGSLRLDAAQGADGIVRKTKPYGGDIVFAGSAELRFPIIRSLHLHGAVFYDVGALAERLKEVSGRSFRHSLGFGVRLLLGGTIPIRLDYGVILDRRCKEADPLTGACVQKEEVGNIHFGIMYTF